MPQLSLPRETSRFRCWAEAQQGRYGEWECLYPDWAALYAAAQQALDDGSWREHAEDMIYLLARDNESEVLREELRERPGVLRELAPLIQDKGEPDARWQLAQTLGELGTGWGAALLSLLADDPDEYVRRRALLAMGASGHPDAEEVARRAWRTGEEYPQIAALHVLCELGVEDRDELLRAAEKSPHEYLVIAAARHRA